ncbi:hypothetical protein HFN71_28560 [Rhizobium laguerreae]|uniref:hypothetical protein n=1 Tax=Rhizobium laguerreae TaxID=1076926 RepID=UPI001C929F5E|nr:hypothetical protein [Rhizobium laguerreae]MBY3543639.1 hypothetical protein [Rhizobium laguerreae]
MGERRSAQEVFDAAYLGLATQGFAQSKSDQFGCAYRGEGGTKCGVGHLIPDDKYLYELEGLSADTPSVSAVAGLSWQTEPLAIDIQGAHDGHDVDFTVSPDQMRDRLAEVAAKHGLTIPEVLA